MIPARILLWRWWLLLATATAAIASPKAVPEHSGSRLGQSGDYVVVVHGLAWIRDTLKPTANHLKTQGYEVVRFKYDSHQALDEVALVQEMTQFLSANCPDTHRRIHFVAHSMGTVITRLFLQRHPVHNLGQVVMLAPPNQGTELADIIAKSKFLQEIFGRGAPALGTKPESLPNRLAPPTYRPGIIMGTRSMFWPTSWLLPGPDDGVIPVERGKLPGMGGFIVLPANHVQLPGHAAALSEIDHYLQTGTFTTTMKDSPANPQGMTTTALPSARRLGIFKIN